MDNQETLTDQIPQEPQVQQENNNKLQVFAGCSCSDTNSNNSFVPPVVSGPSQSVSKEVGA